MEFSHLLPLSALFWLALLGSHVQASLPAEDYWQTMWPNSPMPKALKDLLVQPDWKSGAHVRQQASTSNRVKVSNGVFFFDLYDHHNKESHADNSKISQNTIENPIPVFYHDRNPIPIIYREKNRDDFIYYDRNPIPIIYRERNPIPIIYRERNKDDLIYHDRNPIPIIYRERNPIPIIYKNRDDLTNNKPFQPNGIFFFEHDLLPGKKIILAPMKPSDEFTFLPNKIAKAIPFSSSRLSEILNRLNIEADSTDAKSMKKTLALCEEPAMKGEDKYCATSLESLVDFAVSKLGKNIRLLSTEFERETQDRQYSVAAEGVKELDGEKAMVCHKLDYPYAVFFCHKITKTRTYSVPLVATDDGTKVKAIAVCHTDTSDWPSNSAAMEMLNTKPGASPICHFLYTDTLIWVPQSSSLKDDM